MTDPITQATELVEETYAFLKAGEIPTVQRLNTIFESTPLREAFVTLVVTDGDWKMAQAPLTGMFPQGGNVFQRAVTGPTGLVKIAPLEPHGNAHTFEIRLANWLDTHDIELSGVAFEELSATMAFVCMWLNHRRTAQILLERGGAETNLGLLLGTYMSAHAMPYWAVRGVK